MIFVRKENGELMRYSVYRNEKIAADDVTSLQQAAGAFEDTLTLLTCEDELLEGGYGSRRVISSRRVD